MYITLLISTEFSIFSGVSILKNIIAMMTTVFILPISRATWLVTGGNRTKIFPTL
jgi:hypothetical protein